MKKALFLFPLAAMLLSSCDLSAITDMIPFWPKEDPSSSKSSSSKSSSSKTSSSKTSSSKTTVTISSDESSAGPDTYQGYKKVLTAPEEGKDYIYGVFQCNLDSGAGKQLFMNGDNHRDIDPKTQQMTEYPFYLATTTDVSKAIKIRCHYVDDTKYTMQVVEVVDYDQYLNKYFEVYDAEKADGNHTVSIRLIDEPTAYWRFADKETVDGKQQTLQTNVMDIEYEGSPEVVTMGSSQTYSTFSAFKSSFFGGANNFYGHLWELDEAE